MSPFAKPILHDLRRGWAGLLTTALGYRLAAFVVLWPLVGVVLRTFIAVSGTTAVADQDILYFVLSPVGLLALLVVVALGMAVVALEQACLMAIGFGLSRGLQVTTRTALAYGFAHARPVLRVSWRVILRGLLIAAPFLVAAGAAYGLLLRDHDINYYLAQRPPAFWAAAILIGTLAIGWVLVFAPRLLSWILALPLVLFEEVPPTQALEASRNRTRGKLIEIGLTLAAWAGVFALLGAANLALIGALGIWAVPLTRDSFGLVLTVVGGLVLLWGGGSVVLSLVQAATFALLVTRWFDRLGGGAAATGRFPADLAVSKPSLPGRLSVRRVLAWSGVLVLLAALVGGWLLRQVQTEDRVLVIAHRGAAAAAPENTLASVARAIQDGADLVEIDVQETADGEVVVFHDSDFMKLAGVDLKVWDATFAQLQDLDIGSSFAPEFSGERVPRLAEVLALCKDKVRVDIELKYYGHDQRLEERVAEIVEAVGMESQVILMSLKYEAVRKMKQLRPPWTVGLLAATAVGDLTRLEADFLAVNTGLVSRSFIDRAHRQGKEVYVWTVNDALQMSRLMSMGVDGVITDRPALARLVLTRRATLSSVERLLLNLAFWLNALPDDLVQEAARANELAVLDRASGGDDLTRSASRRGNVHRTEI